jgi:predicted ribosomally synthesized peptide with nif11-like leader
VSIDTVAEFLRTLEEDGAFKKQCQEALETEGPEAVVKLAAERGLEFTADEFAKHVGYGEELDDEALDRVAGGGLQMMSSPRVVRGAFSRAFSRVRGLGKTKMDEDEEVQM